MSKCDELEAEQWLDYSGEPNMCYPADKVKEAIAELKAENERLKATPEQIMKEVFDKCLIYPKDMVRLDDAYTLAVALRTTRRALWLARAERAKEVNCKIKFAICAMNTKYDYSDADKWVKVERLCRAKAEQYKEESK